MSAVIDLHLVRAARAGGHDLKSAIAQAAVDHGRCRDIRAGDTVVTPEGNTGRVLFIWAATQFAPTMALVQIDWFRRSYPLKDLTVPQPRAPFRFPGLRGWRGGH